jgi:radical SAM protein with 4Fe4S-binding SPASM domain
MNGILEFVDSEAEDKFGVTISGGEPFVRKDLPQIIGLVASHSVGQITITTNGSLVTEDVLDQILCHRQSVPVSIQVSIDSAVPSEHDKFRGHPGAFAKAAKAIALVQERGLTATMRATVCKGKIPTMKSLVELAQSFQVTSIGFGTVVPFGRAIDNSMGMEPIEKRDYFLEMVRLKEEFGPSLDVITEDPLKFALRRDDVWDYGGVDLDDECSIGGCTAGINTFNVTSRGLVTPCAVLPITILDANQKSADEIRREYANSLIVRNLLVRKLNGKCGSCRLKQVCGGCRAVAYSLGGGLLGSDNTCWL